MYGLITERSDAVLKTLRKRRKKEEKSEE